jgi:hypothetical protein
MKQLHKHKEQEVGCCVDKERGYFQPTLGRKYLLPVTPGMKHAKTLVVEPDTTEEALWKLILLLPEVNMSLTVDVEQEDDESKVRTSSKKWLFNTGASIYITQNKRNLCDYSNITQVI